MSAGLGALDRLIEAFGKLPGVGAKTAERLAHHILKCPSRGSPGTIAEAIRDAKDRVRHCQGLLPPHRVRLRNSAPSAEIIETRRRSLVCVVEQPRDLMALERAGKLTSGVYHVLLGRLAPLQGSGAGPAHARRPGTARVFEAGNVREVIMATNPERSKGTARRLLVANRLVDTGVGGHSAGPRPGVGERAGVRQQGNAGRRDRSGRQKVLKRNPGEERRPRWTSKDYESALRIALGGQRVAGARPRDLTSSTRCGPAVAISSQRAADVPRAFDLLGDGLPFANPVPIPFPEPVLGKKIPCVLILLSRCGPT